MITLFQLKNIRTKEVIAVDSFVRCTNLCITANSITKGVSFEVTPATLESISIFDGVSHRKPIFYTPNLDDVECISGINSPCETKSDWRPKGTKEKVADYLKKIKNSQPPRKKISKKK